MRPQLQGEQLGERGLGVLLEQLVPSCDQLGGRTRAGTAYLRSKAGVRPAEVI
ncbi:hypothetical protein [Ornithinimicrobium avium]|uniref:hypothetical protein n=1 Tax=Ornithinimicrobium avium TaxID=2283195 RepID=UPI0022773BED|nr:hypothetical protein [Ornithinimicrobium avium]